MRHTLQAPILDEALVDDDVHVVSRLSGLTQLLDANVTEEEKVLDALDDLLHFLANFLVLRFSTVRISTKRFLLVANSAGGTIVDAVIRSVVAIAREWKFA